MPKWEDIKVLEHYWNKRDDGHKIEIRVQGETGKDIVTQLNSITKLRDACYSALKDKEQDFKQCNNISNCCVTCIFQKDWYGAGKDYQ